MPSDTHLSIPKQQLSIEPLSGSSDSSDSANYVGVAFFEVDHSLAQDPALTPCELAFRARDVVAPVVLDARALHHPPSSSNRNHHHHSLRKTPPGSAAVDGGGLRSLSHPSPPVVVSRRVSHDDGTASSSSVASLALKVRNDGVHLVNWTQLTRVEVLEGEKHSEANAGYLAKPSCLLLYFPSCLFRIFSLDKAAPVAAYLAMKSALLRVLAQSNTVRPFLSLSDWDSVHTSPNSSKACASTAPPSDPEAAAQREALLQHQQHAHNQCWNEFQSLWSMLLDHPASSVISSFPTGASRSSSSNLGRDIAALITAVARDLAASMGSKSESESPSAPSGRGGSPREQRHRELDELLQATRSDMDNALRDFFPAPRSRKRPRLTTSPSAAALPLEAAVSAAAKNPPPSVSNPPNLVAHVEALLQQHRRLIRESHELLRLPTR